MKMSDRLHNSPFYSRHILKWGTKVFENSSSHLRTVEPNPAAGQSIVLPFNILWQLILRQLLQQSSDTVSLELGSPRVSDQHLGAVGFDAVVQPAVKAGGEDFIVEHVAQEDQVESFDVRTNHVLGHTNGRVQAVQLRVHVCGNDCNCNTKQMDEWQHTVKIFRYENALRYSKIKYFFGSGLGDNQSGRWLVGQGLQI